MRKGTGWGANAGSKGGDKRGYDYVEIMACPGECVNGGGQISRPAGFKGTDRADETDNNGRWGDREWTARVEKAYWQGLDGRGEEEVEPLAGEIRKDLASRGRGNLLRTEYRRVESEVVGLSVQW